MFVSASTRCFSDKSFAEACHLLTDLEYDKIEFYFDETGDHLKATEVTSDADGFYARYREITRLTPIAFTINYDVDLPTLTGLSKLAKLMRVTQITVPASPIGTPFNAEIDRLRGFVDVTNVDAVRLSIKTETGQLTEDPLTAVELCRAVKGLGLTLDPSYYICGPNHGKSFDAVYPYVYHVHLRDSTTENLQVQIGLGQVDYTRLISQLGQQNYNRALAVDIYPSMINGSSRPLEMRKLRMLLETLL